MVILKLIKVFGVIFNVFYREQTANQNTQQEPNKHTGYKLEHLIYISFVLPYQELLVCNGKFSLFIKRILRFEGDSIVDMLAFVMVDLEFVPKVKHPLFVSFSDNNIAAVNRVAAATAVGNNAHIPQRLNFGQNAALNPKIQAELRVLYRCYAVRILPEATFYEVYHL